MFSVIKKNFSKRGLGPMSCFLSLDAVVIPRTEAIIL